MVHVGNICFDITVCPGIDSLSIFADAYELYKDSGYGYTSNGIPYDESGTVLICDPIEDLAVDDFKARTECLIKNFINDEGLLNQAEKETIIW